MERKAQRRADRLGMKRHWQAGLLASTALSAVLALPLPAAAQSISATATPQGGVVVGGSATITQAPASTTIDQTSQRAAIDFQSFDVGSAAKVQINQPGANSVELDRVVGGNLSQINGQINSNGQVVLINQSGVVFGKGSQVNAENVVVSTSNIATSDFMAGHLVFSGAPKPGAQIINDGRITARNAGLVGLVAPQVANNGVITAQLGQVVLAGASAFTLDLYGDRLISLDVTRAVRAVDVGGKVVPALVTNSGLILADGGKITLTAQDADALVTQLINAGGTIRADSVGAASGTISISGVGGDISIAGNLLAQGGNGAKGGDIQALTSGTVAVAGSAVLDSSGDAGGGVIALGTDIARAQAGAADVAAPRAASVTVAQGAVLRADAKTRGNGGKITLLSHQKTDFKGMISLTGGSLGGNGGLAEISSDGVISLDGTVLDTAAHGRSGEVLLDPATLVVGTGTVAAGSAGVTGDVTYGTDNSTVSYISPTVLDALTGTIVLQASTLVSVVQAVSISSANSELSIVSGGNVSISASIFVNGSLEIDAGNLLNIGAGLNASDILLSSGNAGTDINAVVSAGNGAGVLTLASTGTIFEAANGVIDTGTLLSAGSIGGDASLGNAGNLISDISNFNAANITLVSAGSLSTGGTVAGNNISLSAAALTVGGTLAAGHVLALNSAGSISEPGGVVSAATLTGGAVGNFELQARGNSIANLRGVSVSAGDFALVDTGSLNVSGGVTAQDIYLSAPTLGVKALLAATLGSTATLAVAANSISVAGGSFSVANGILEIAPLSAGTAIDFGKNSSAGTLGLPGSVVAAFDNSASLIEIGKGAVGVQASSIGIDGSVSFASAPLVVLSTSGTVADNSGTFAAGALGIDAGSVTQAAAAAFDVTLLEGAGAAIAGNVVLPGAANAITTVASLVAVGTLAINDTGTLGLQGLVQGGNVSLSAPDIALAANGTVAAVGGTPVLSLAGNTISAGTGAALLAPGGTVALAPFSAGRAILLGAASTATKLGIGADVIGAIDPGTGVILIGGAAGGNITIASGSLSFASAVDLSTGGSVFDFGTLSGGTITYDAASGFTQGVNGAIEAGLFGSDGVASGGNVLLDGGANTIAALGSFGGAIGTLSVMDNGALTIAGAMAVSTATLSADTLVISSDIGVSNVLALGSTGSISQTGGSISATVLKSYGSIGGDATLASATNNIGTLGAFTLGGALDLADAGLLKVTGPVLGSAISLSAGTINLAGNLTAAGNLALGGGTVTQSAGAVIAGTLVSLDSIGGNVVLTRGNSIASLGGFTLGGNLTLNDTQTLDISGTVATPGALTLTGTGLTESTGALDIGSLTTGTGSFSGAVTLAGANSIATLGKFTLATGQILNLNDATPLDITGLVSLPGGSLDYTGSGVSETGAGVVAAATFTTGGQTVAGNILLTGANNIGVLDNAAATGTLALNNTAALSLQDGIAAQDIFLVAPTLNLSTALASQVIAGALTAPGTLALAANVYAAGAGPASLSAPGGTIELAAYSSGTVIDLGNAGAAGTLGLPASVLANFGTDAARIIIGNGAVGTLASGILIDQSLSFGGTTVVDLATSGTIADRAGTLSAATLAFSAAGFTQNAAAAIDAGMLQGDGGSISGSVLLGGTANAIGTLAAMTVGGTLELLDTGLLTVAGGLAAPVVSLASDTINIAGNISAPTRLALGSTGSIGQSAGSISTASLVSIGTIGGAVSLAGANSIATLGAFTLGGALDLTDTGLLSVAGPVNAAAISLVAGSIAITGNVTAPGLLALGATGGVSQSGGSLAVGTLGGIGTLGGVSLANAANNIGTLAGLVASGDMLLADASSLVIAGLVATPGQFILQTGGGVSAGSGGIVDAGSFTSGTGTIGGDVYLANGNSIGNLGNLVLGGGATLTLADAEALRITGGVTAGVVVLTSSGSVVETGAGLIDTGLLGTGAGSIAGDLRLTGANSIAGLGMLVTGGTFVLDNTGALGITGPVSAAVVSLADNGTITLGGAVSGTSGYVTILADGLLQATGGTVAAPGGTIVIAPFTSGRSVDLGGTQANALDLSAALVGALDPTARLLAIGGANTGSLLAEGNIAVNNPTLALAAAGPVSLTGKLAGNDILLSGDGVSLNGTLAGTSVLLASAGTISQNQSGVLAVGTLTGSGVTGGDVSLAGTANAIGTLGHFSVSGDFSALDAGTLVVAGPVVANNITLTENGAAAANSLAVDGTLLAGPGGMIALAADAMSAAGALISAPGGTVQFSPYDAGTAIDLGGTSAGLDLSAGLLGAVSSQTGILKIITTGALQTDGNVTLAPASVLLSGNGITFNGGLDLPGASTLALASTNGVTAASGESLTAGLLMGAGTITGPVALGLGVNHVGTLGAFSLTGAGDDFAFSDASALVVASPITAGNIVLNAAGLTIANVVSAVSGLTLGSSAGIVETGAGALDGVVLSGTTAGIGGDVVLTGLANNIGTLGAMSLSSGALSLTDNGSLNVGGNVSAGSITLVAGTIGLSAGLSVATVLALDGLSGGVTQVSGAIIAPTLTSDGVTIGGAALLGDAGNNIGTLGGFAASGQILINDAAALAIAGLVTTPGELSLESAGAISELAGGLLNVGTLDSGGTAIGGDVALGNANSIAALGGFTLGLGHTLSLRDATALSVAGEVVASTVTLVASSISVPGSLVVAGLLALGGSGGVSESGAGAINAGSLVSQGSIGGDVSLGGGNSIAILGGFTLGGTLALADSGLLTVAGPVAGQVVDLSAGTIDLAGNITAPEAIALGSLGNVVQSGGVLSTASLRSQGSIGGNVTLAGANSIAALGGFTLGGTLALADTGLLTVTGPVAGLVVSLSAGTIDLAGDITAPDEVALGSTGTIFQSGGVLTTKQLVSQGSIGGDVSLGDANAVGTLGAFTLGGALNLADAGLLVVAGPVAAQVVSLAAGTMDIAGNITAPGQIALGSTGTIFQSAGVISTNTLVSQNTIGGDVTLADANLLGTLGGFAAAGNIILTDANALVVAGPVHAANAIIGAAGLTVNGQLASTGTLAIASNAGITEGGAGQVDAATLTSIGTIGGNIGLDSAANSIASLGVLAATGALTLKDAVALAISGDVHLGGTLGLGDASSITQTGGIISATMLNSDGGTIGGNVVLGQSGNEIPVLGDFAAAGDVTLEDASALTLAGNVSAGNRLGLFSGGVLSQASGVISAGTLDAGASAITLTDANQIGALGSVNTAGALDVSGASGLAGPLTAASATIATPGDFSLTGNANVGGVLTLHAGGVISQSGGTVSAAAVRMSATGDIDQTGGSLNAQNVTLSGANVTLGGNVDASSGIAIDPAGGFTQTGGAIAAPVVLIAAGGDVRQSAGSLSAQTATISGGNIDLSGYTSIANTLDVIATGNVTHGSGTLDAGLFEGSAPQFASFGSVTDFGTLGSFIMHDSQFILNNNGPLVITGPVVANSVIINAIGQITLAGSGGGGLFITGSIAPNNQALPRPGDSVITSTAGPNSPAGIVQTGNFLVNSGQLANSFLGTQTQAATLFLYSGPAGPVSFAAYPNALIAPSVDVVISAGPYGVVTGNINVAHIEILSAFSTDLTGLINNIAGSSAAAGGSVDPFPQPNFRFNTCPIGSVNCTILPIESIPEGNPLDNFDLKKRKRKKLDHNIELPGIATRDY